MSDHSRALIPLETWHYSSPELRSRGRLVDIGLLAESLIYYDQVLLNVANQPQFAEVLSWFVRQKRLGDLAALISDGTIQIYEYSFLSTAVSVKGDDSVTFLNLQDKAQERANSFMERFLGHPSVRGSIPNPRERRRLEYALAERIFEVKADSFGATIDNARADFTNPQRGARIVQRFVDELYRFKRLGKAPEITANVVALPDGRARIAWNIDFDALSRIAGDQLLFRPVTPITAAINANRFLWSAAQLNCDLYLGRPLSSLVGDKLYESVRVTKIPEIVDRLEAKVAFPDIRALTNHGVMKLPEILRIRRKAKRFRTWLQSEAERDRDAIIAYHHEVAKESGWVRAGRHSLRMFGVVGGSTAGTLIAGTESMLWGVAAGSLVSANVQFLFDLAAKQNAGWRPVVFGNWLRDRVHGQ